MCSDRRLVAKMLANTRIVLNNTSAGRQVAWVPSKQLLVATTTRAAGLAALLLAAPFPRDM
ncbi:hypothetical protein HaLaN_09842 [Haematococcus lacustris]|uniref:Uncharacterized protein n=1 Tax=Haematococcus lacustris TaxID=44745 RepID=A0A699YVX3_HAELA|nr:hypothetical protein HaLaN_09842 [Haematococcus lacustris]